MMEKCIQCGHTYTTNWRCESVYCTFTRQHDAMLAKIARYQAIQQEVLSERLAQDLPVNMHAGQFPIGTTQSGRAGEGGNDRACAAWEASPDLSKLVTRFEVIDETMRRLREEYK
jgi:hypothetical protein